eukprot:2659631-Rhodomonas_salina.1
MPRSGGEGEIRATAARCQGRRARRGSVGVRRAPGTASMSGTPQASTPLRSHKVYTLEAPGLRSSPGIPSDS